MKSGVETFRGSCNIFDDPGCPCVGLLCSVLIMSSTVIQGDDMLICNFNCLIEALSGEVVVVDFDSTTVHEHFLEKFTFKFKVVRREFPVAVDCRSSFDCLVF